MAPAAYGFRDLHLFVGDEPEKLHPKPKAARVDLF